MTGRPGGTGWTHPALVAAFEQNERAIVALEGPHLVVVGSNAATRRIVRGKKALGLPFAEAYAELLGQQVIELFLDCYRTGRPGRGRDWRFELEGGSGERQVVHLDFDYFPWRDASGQVVGVICEATDVTDDVAAREEQGHRDAEAAERRYRGALEVSRTIQQALLPPNLPVLPGFDLAARYLLAAEEAAAGGDWFDAVLRPDGRVALVVGDVVGHGVRASATMGQLRAVLHERLLSAATLEEALRDLDRFATTVEDARAATVCVAVVDVASGELAWCTAGHPPPLVIGTDGRAEFLAPSGTGPLATGAAYAVSTGRLERDAVLLLYSDGLVERPGRTTAECTVELAEVAGRSYLDTVQLLTDSARTVERVCGLSLERLTRVSGRQDDITLLAAQLTPAIAPLDLTTTAVPESVGLARRELASWLAALEVRPVDETALQHVVGELTTNVVEHAYPPGSPGPLRVRAWLTDDGVARLTVQDEGRWTTPETTSVRGRGLPLVGDLADELVLDRSPGGTSAHVVHRLSRSAQVAGARDVAGSPGRGAAPSRGSEPFLELEGAGRLLRVSGPVDLVTSGRLGAVVRAMTTAGPDPVRVDLTDVSVLSSSGVQVLFDLRGRGVELAARPGSAAQHVLELVRLPYVERWEDDEAG